MKFADHIDRHFFNNGEMTPAKSIERFMSRANEIQLAIIAESARWGDHYRDSRNDSDAELHTYHDHWLPERERILERYLPVRRDIFLQQLADAGLYPGTDLPAEP